MFLKETKRFKDGKEHHYWSLVKHKPALFSHLQERWKDLFAACFDVLLYDLTSTYFESEG